jgi:ribosomal protein S18 acetylase RimI-like enzyme
MADTQLQRMAASLQAWQRALGRAAAGGQVIEMDGLVASIVPAARSRSLVNAAVVPHGGALDGAVLARLGDVYREAGGEVWGVWVHDGNHAVRAELERAGYVLDSHPAAMALEIDSLSPAAAPAGVTVQPTRDLRLLAGPLGAGYGFPAQFLTHGLPALLDHCEAWIAHVDGTPAAGLLIVIHQRDAGVFMVATAPELRRRGAATHALRIALLDARQRGCTTSTLQASAMGESVYTGLGYRTLGNYELWERRPR